MTTAVDDRTAELLSGPGDHPEAPDLEPDLFAELHAKNQVLIERSGKLVSDVRAARASLATPQGVLRCFQNLNRLDQQLVLADEYVNMSLLLAMHGKLAAVVGELAATERLTAALNLLDPAKPSNGSSP